MPPHPIIGERRAEAVDAIPAELLDLAPLHLPNLRAERYQAETIGVPIGAFAATDEEIIRRAYRQINELMAILAAESTVEAISNGLRDFLRTADFDHLRTEMRTLGQATFEGDRPDQVTAKAIHDMRGGAFAVLLLRLEIHGEDSYTRDELRTLFLLARDHGKIMRSTVSDLDLVRRQKDLAPQSHHVRLLTDKWHKAAVGPASNPQMARLFVDCRFDGAVTECCLESAAIDRIFYNLMGNAQRHHAGDRLDLLIFEIPSAPGENLRFVLRNGVSGVDEQRLRDLAGADGRTGDLGALFQPGVSTTGSGLGLAVVADLVTQAFGVAHESDALRLGYYGARLVEEKFTVWFHWPIARGGLGTNAASDAAEDVPADLQVPAGTAAGNGN